MRLLTIVLVLVLAPQVARADTGVYFAESISGTAYQGDLGAYGEGGLRLAFGINIRQDRWTTEVLGGCIIQDTNAAASRHGGYCFAGFDLNRRWPLAEWRRFGVRVALHGGPRYFVGSGALHGYDGPGVSAGARIEGDVWVIGYFLGVGVDAMWLRMPVDGAAGYAPFIGIGAKLGWL